MLTKQKFNFLSLIKSITTLFLALVLMGNFAQGVQVFAAEATLAQVNAALACVPNNPSSGGTVNCTGTLPINATLASLSVKVGASGTVTPCTLVTNPYLVPFGEEPFGEYNYGGDNTKVTMTCNNVPVGNTSGPQDVIASGGVTGPVDTLNVGDRNATLADLTINCTPEQAIINTTVVCRGALAPGTSLSNLSVKIDPNAATPPTPCTLSGTPVAIECLAVPVGSTLGPQNVVASGGLTGNVDTVTVIAPPASNKARDAGTTIIYNSSKIRLNQTDNLGVKDMPVIIETIDLVDSGNSRPLASGTCIYKFINVNGAILNSQGVFEAAPSAAYTINGTIANGVCTSVSTAKLHPNFPSGTNFRARVELEV